MKGELSRAQQLFNEATCQMSAGFVSQAEAGFREALSLEPHLAQAHTNIGLLLEQRGKGAEAERHYLQAISADPKRAKAHLNLGALLAGQKRFEEAEAAYLRALELAPDSPAAWSNLGVLQACRKQEGEAELSYRKAIDLDPGYRLAHFNLSYLLLRQGRFEEGWQCLEARDWYVLLEKHIRAPRWRGESLQGRSLLIGFEAGHGDMIQMCRYAALLKARGTARIALMCHPALKTLFNSLTCVDQVFAYDETLPPTPWDFWTPPFSIAYYCQTRIDSIPVEIPYLATDLQRYERWRGVMAGDSPCPDLAVGLVWKGSAGFENDADRSLPHLNTLAPLGQISQVRFFSLQKGAGEDEAANPPVGLPLLDLGPQIVDFADSAAIITNLDLVICVDTAIAHLAGALGKECWVLLPDYQTDWRWLKNRSDSPWYPSLRLFRQPPGEKWEGVIATLSLALAKLAASHCLDPGCLPYHGGADIPR